MQTLMAQLQLCLLALLALTVVAEDATSKLTLPADVKQVALLKSEFGVPPKINRAQIAATYNRKYVPDNHGPNFGVPAQYTERVQYVSWREDMYCKDYGCFNPAPNPEPYFPTLYDWVANNPDLTIVKQIMDIIGPEVFNGPFTGTMFLPTDQAMSLYLSRLALPVADLVSPEFKDFITNFFIKLLQYHTLLLRVYGAQFTGTTYSTAYANLNGFPHKITFGGGQGSSGCDGGCGSGGCGDAGGCSGTSCDGCSGCSGCNGGIGNHNGIKDQGPSQQRGRDYNSNPPCSGTGCSGGCSSCPGGCGCARNYLIDEQGNIVTFDQVDKFVYGGGVVHTVNGVLQPNDIFPSLGAALQGNDFSIMRAVLAKIDITLNTTFLALMEQVPGTLAVPSNEAFAGVNIDAIPVSTLVYIVSYHFCQFKRAYRLLYTPFNGKPGKNPCLTLYSRATGFKYGLLCLKCSTSTSGWKVDERNFTSNGVTERPNMWISYATPKADGQLEVASTTIIVPDITMPVHSAHVINKVMVPPANPGTGLQAASTVIKTLSSKDAGSDIVPVNQFNRDRYNKASEELTMLSPTRLKSRQNGNHKRFLRLLL